MQIDHGLRGERPVRSIRQPRSAWPGLSMAGRWRLSPIESGFQGQVDLGNDTLSGGDGNDFLAAAAGDDLADGGSGADQILSTLGADVLLGGDDNDFVTLSSPSGGAADGGDGDDLIQSFVAEGVPDQISCGGGADQVFPGVGDIVAVDCESVAAEFICTAATCPGTISVVAPPPPADRALARRHAGSQPEPQPVVLATSKFKVKKGLARPTARLSNKRVKRLLKKRNSARVTRILTVEKRGKNAKPAVKRTKAKYTLRK